MTTERKRPAIMESHPVTCTNCGHVTNISYNRRKDEPRLCRNCGATIAEPPTEAQPMKDADRKALQKHVLEIVKIANDLLKQLRVLGETPEEREQTLKAFKGLAPPELRVAATQYRERRALLAYLDKGAPPQEVET